MKTRLNILTVLLLTLFACSIGYEVYKGSVDFRQGFRTGYESHESLRKSDYQEVKALGEKRSLTLMLNTDKDMPVDSIYNKKTGSYYPVEYSSIAVYTKDEEPAVIFVTQIAYGFFSLFLLPLLFVCFYKTITAIKSGNFFYRGNIVKLRLMGLAFCALAFLEGVCSYYILKYTKDLFEFNGYSIVSGEWFASSFWIYGLISFLVAEVFAFGLKLKEEQDLTI